MTHTGPAMKATPPRLEAGPLVSSERPCGPHLRRQLHCSGDAADDGCVSSIVKQPEWRDPPPQDRSAPSSCRLVSGTVVELRCDEQLRNVIVSRDGQKAVVLDQIDLMVIDFLSYETIPSRSVTCDGLKLDEAGFVTVDRRQRTNIDGLLPPGTSPGHPPLLRLPSPRA